MIFMKLKKIKIEAQKIVLSNLINQIKEKKEIKRFLLKLIATFLTNMLLSIHRYMANIT